MSVLMPVYDAEPYLSAAVNSVLAQSYDGFEFIIVNDGSTDRSPETLRTIAARDDRVRLVDQPNAGIAKTRNKLVDLAAGKYLAWMDADDIAVSERLATQVEYLDSHESVVAVGSFFEMIDSADRRIHIQRLPADNVSMQAAALRGAMPMCNPSIMVRADAIRAAGLYDESVEPAEDLDMILRLGEIGELANIEQVLMRYRLHSESASEAYSEKQVAGMRESVRRAGERRGVAVTFEGGGGWRPGPGRSSRHFYNLKYGWWAFNLGETKTAAHYAKRAIATMPWRFGGWNLLRCAIFKIPPSEKGKS